MGEQTSTNTFHFFTTCVLHQPTHIYQLINFMEEMSELYTSLVCRSRGTFSLTKRASHSLEGMTRPLVSIFNYGGPYSQLKLNHISTLIHRKLFPPTVVVLTQLQLPNILCHWLVLSMMRRRTGKKDLRTSEGLLHLITLSRK